MDNEEIEIESNSFSYKNDYIIIKIDNSFIKNIEIYLYIEIVSLFFK